MELRLSDHVTSACRGQPYQTLNCHTDIFSDPCDEAEICDFWQLFNTSSVLQSIGTGRAANHSVIFSFLNVKFHYIDTFLARPNMPGPEMYILEVTPHFVEKPMLLYICCIRTFSGSYQRESRVDKSLQGLECTASALLCVCLCVCVCVHVLGREGITWPYKCLEAQDRLYHCVWANTSVSGLYMGGEGRVFFLPQFDHLGPISKDWVSACLFLYMLIIGCEGEGRGEGGQRLHRHTQQHFSSFLRGWIVTHILTVSISALPLCEGLTKLWRAKIPFPNLLSGQDTPDPWTKLSTKIQLHYLGSSSYKKTSCQDSCWLHEKNSALTIIINNIGKEKF